MCHQLDPFPITYRLVPPNVLPSSGCITALYLAGTPWGGPKRTPKRTPKLTPKLTSFGPLN